MSTPSREPDPGDAFSRHRAALLPDGSYRFEDDLAVDGVVEARVITCEAWLFERYDVTGGAVAFVCGDALVHPPGARFAVLFPPFSITRPRFEGVRARLVGLAATAPLPAPFMRAPVVFAADCEGELAGPGQVLEALGSARDVAEVGAVPDPSPRSRRAKALIDRNYRDHPSIARIAERLGVSHEHLTRGFKRDYGLSPSAYAREVRLADVPLRLARGEAIVDVSGEAGYNDLSRFYKQFRKSTRSSPGACRAALAPPRRRA